MTRRIKITSYFSLPTDLAGEMRSWKEFVSGVGYSVDLKDNDSGEAVTINYVEKENEFDYVIIESNSPGELFDKVIGKAVRLLVMHSDSLMIDR